jgi:hypothetical protein
MGAILVLLFLAKGLFDSTNFCRDPLYGLNQFVYQNVPLMSMFREPVSKFTMLIIPFLALLIGFGAEKIANLRLPKLSLRSNKILIISALVLTFIVAVGPIIVYNPIESKTEELPYSSYVKIPNYWYNAVDWLNNQPGNGKVLLTPIDDFYEMPYNWTNGWDGYYGTDQLIDSMINKPIISTNILSGYKINNDTAATLFQLGYAIRSGRVGEFKDFLDMLGVRYILQRNDINNLVADASALQDGTNNVIAYRNTLQDGRKISEGSITSPADMKNFFAAQSYLQFKKTFDKLDIYEYVDSKPSFYVSALSSSQNASIIVQSNPTLQKDWNFSSKAADNWESFRHNETALVSPLDYSDNYTASANLSGQPNVWGIIESPSVLVQYRSIYTINSTGYQNGDIYNVYAKIVQFGQDNNNLNTTWIVKNAGFTGSSKNSPGNWSWIINLRFEPLNVTKFFKIQIWFNINPNLGNNPDRRGTIWIDECNVTSEIPFLNTGGLNTLSNEKVQNQTAAVLNVQEINPTKIVVTVNATEPFVLATSYTLDDSWIANVNNQQIKPSPIYLGFSGFQINQTGQFDVIIEYKPQTWFIYASAISITSVGLIFAIYLYVRRDSIRSIFKKIVKKKSEVLR